MAEIVKKGADNPLIVSPKVPGIPSSMIENCERKYGIIHVPENPISGVRHIGIHIANGQYIHSQGYIHINSLRKNDQDYDEENTKRFLFAQRYFV